VRFSFRDIPDPGGSPIRARPILDIVVEGFDTAPQACLIDSGATAVRMTAEVAEFVGIDLSDSPTAQIAVGGALVTGRMAEVTLQLADEHETYEWSAPVWFCDPWLPAFGLLGLHGFFDHFVVTITSYEELIEVVPINA
jgi:hypothetical protein